MGISSSSICIDSLPPLEFVGSELELAAGFLSCSGVSVGATVVVLLGVGGGDWNRALGDIFFLGEGDVMLVSPEEGAVAASVSGVLSSKVMTVSLYSLSGMGAVAFQHRQIYGGPCSPYISSIV